MVKYIAKFTELTRFADDYVTTYMAKVRKFQNRIHLILIACWETPKSGHQCRKKTLHFRPRTEQFPFQ